jgi:hypothetical protein
MAVKRGAFTSIPLQCVGEVLEAMDMSVTKPEVFIYVVAGRRGMEFIDSVRLEIEY